MKEILVGTHGFASLQKQKETLLLLAYHFFHLCNLSKVGEN
jgi:hypothetical protein